MGENKIDLSITAKYSVVGHGGEFIILESTDKIELKIYHMSNDLLMPKAISIEGKVMNFALTRLDGTEDSFLLIVCTFDNKWANACEIHPLQVRVALNWLEMAKE